MGGLLRKIQRNKGKNTAGHCRKCGRKMDYIYTNDGKAHICQPCTIKGVK